MTTRRLKPTMNRDRKRGRPGKDTRITCTDVHGKTVARQCTYELGVFVFQQWIDQAERNELRFVQIVRRDDPASYREWTAANLLSDANAAEDRTLLLPGLGGSFSDD